MKKVVLALASAMILATGVNAKMESEMPKGVVMEWDKVFAKSEKVNHKPSLSQVLVCKF